MAMLPKEALQQLQTHGVLQYALQYDIYGGGGKVVMLIKVSCGTFCRISLDWKGKALRQKHL